MGFLDKVLGNASTINLDEVRTELEEVLIPSETIISAYKVVRNLLVFTDKRLILIDKQGMTGKKVEYKSIPYKSISRFSVESTGRFDLDVDMKIWISSEAEPSTVINFSKGTPVAEIQQTLAQAILG
ncbi:PH domain-containing protein [Listeria booriae]|uniref:PH domain-containing protein n=1 Tax=Listeria booriae TaxID=1552123 RepID=A0A7X0XYM0_9LIST|nr:PH domain-containing protein [Listeria booriae]MBC1794168.1 PH domain-containing protein [Listeria booriae]MBC1795762.1 PH domain-containing protein [Listeria booriae]MBC1800079.1 PH domain-containing protein [Listeria booriae]MBC1804487.1 PH domain-containing protein [Listeria booriae]MBC1813583.1 PH domain-containing protein [Listeria booriae]